MPAALRLRHITSSIIFSGGASDLAAREVSPLRLANSNYRYNSQCSAAKRVQRFCLPAALTSRMPTFSDSGYGLALCGGRFLAIASS